jgi:intein/homing endonuclease
LITAGKILKCWATKEVDFLYRISLSNGKFVECTENHPFLLKEGDMVYKRADELKVGTLLKNKLDIDISVVGVEEVQLEEKEWVYDLEVEEFHNFCLESDIFVHNSQEDLRFSSAVRQYQSYFVEGLLHVGLVQLYLNGFGRDEIDAFEIEMNNNSTLAEKNKNELLQQRFDLAHAALDTSSGGIALMSYVDVLKNVLKFSDDEISRTFTNQMMEKKLIWRLNQLTEAGFYEEPDPEKKKAVMKGMTDTSEDVFKDLQYESEDLEKLGVIKEILNEKVMKEINYLSKPYKAKPSISQVDMVIDLQKERLNRNIKKTFIDMGLKKDVLND